MDKIAKVAPISICCPWIEEYGLTYNMLNCLESLERQKTEASFLFVSVEPDRNYSPGWLCSKVEDTPYFFPKM